MLGLKVVLAPILVKKLFLKADADLFDLIFLFEDGFLAFAVGSFQFLDVLGIAFYFRLEPIDFFFEIKFLGERYF